ncbi:putative carboxypeptidase [Aequorivita sublithincola DSM 14238]|uniref:Putative carboxypeptidase n=1 Tax=Aequorivita sublithincola (strain DSM 14238 / LMG 21431 / ACAM 643 / 9-3) TaxID=746697 RepID=I3YYM0_AEQSU|nr:M14 family zinc carboxypeptidase [Aequorivita sublithincola]AFL82088.1 putative carboxypeptidase [Aequorivita sublithincola DSM 14238]
MKIDSWYQDHFEFRLSGRYITMQHIYPLLDMYKLNYEISVPGLSENGLDIPLIKIGSGSEIILGWSQMHGNESTTTKALFDFLKFVSQKQHFQKEIDRFLNKYTFYVFPILNPDGAKLYTRENANEIDLNRDAKNLSQKESQCLRNAFETLKPSLCLNLHDQRSIYGFKDGKPATVSFLAPAADKERTVTDSRKIAMKHIVKMNATLQKFIPEEVGRYDDSFNDACVGDTFQKSGVSTILFEAGHFKQDYQREKTREFIFYSLLSLFDIIDENEASINYEEYFDIPENLKNYNDFILRNVKLQNHEKLVSIAIQYEEVLKNDRIDFEAIIQEIGDLKDSFGHLEKNIKGTEILTNSQDNLTVGANISEIIDKSNNSILYFQ